jgi:hypothetical protein
MMADEITRRLLDAGDASRRMRHRGHTLERAVKAVEQAIELHTHLKRERPPGTVVGRRRRSTRVRDVIGMILRLEHVEHVRPERLRSLHHE